MILDRLPIFIAVVGLSLTAVLMAAYILSSRRW